jgi:hypothetical protein
MPRRGRNSGGGGGSFDSLLDTMTNVVGILVIVLVVTLLGVRDAVRRIKWELPDISEAKLRELRLLADLKQRELNQAEASVEEARDVLGKLKAAEAELDALRNSLKLTTPEAQLEQYAKSIDALRKQMTQIETETQDAAAELERLRQQLETLPKSNPAATKMVRLPNPRSPAPGSTCAWFMCRHNRIARMDVEALLEQALARIAASRYMLVSREGGRILKVAADDRQRHAVLRDAVNWVFEPQKLEGYFKQKNIGDRDFRLTLQIHPTLNTERLFATLRPDGGEAVAQLQTSVSRFEAAIRDLDKASQYARFIVWPDSFEVYIRAREIVEKHGVPAGWIMHTGDHWPIGWDFGLNVKGEKKPEPSPVAAQPAAKPIAPVAVLD